MEHFYVNTVQHEVLWGLFHVKEENKCLADH